MFVIVEMCLKKISNIRMIDANNIRSKQVMPHEISRIIGPFETKEDAEKGLENIAQKKYEESSAIQFTIEKPKNDGVKPNLQLTVTSSKNELTTFEYMIHSLEKLL